MKIDFSLYQPIIPNTTKKETHTNTNQVENAPDSKQSVKETVQKYIEEMQKAQNSTGEDNLNVQRIMGKFKFGKKLTSQEMAYIRRHAPGLVDQIQRVMREREIMERGMKIAKTKYHVHMVAFHSASLIEKRPSEERIVLSSHLSDAKKEYEKTEEYKEKPTGPLEKEKKPKLKKHKTKKQKEFTALTYSNAIPPSKKIKVAIKPKNIEKNVK